MQCNLIDGIHALNSTTPYYGQGSFSLLLPCCCSDQVARHKMDNVQSSFGTMIKHTRILYEIVCT
jgi:hypothetical protein